MSERFELVKMSDTRRRVKLYTLNEDRQWEDRGTGHVCCSDEETSLTVTAESDGTSLFTTSSITIIT